MANKKYEEADIQAIATTIREKTGTDKLYDTSEMASGVNEVYEAGVKSEYDRFWGVYQNYGNPMVLRSAFEGKVFSRQNFRPKYDIVSSADSANQIFYNWSRGEKFSLKEHLEELGIKLDLSKAKASDLAFAYCSDFTELPEIRVYGGGVGLFRNCFNLKTIEKLAIGILSNTNTMFQSCDALENIVWDSEIPISISFSSSPLTVESMKSIITHLKDYSTEAPFTYTLTLKSDRWTLLDAEGNTSPNGNTWREYATDKGWLTV